MIFRVYLFFQEKKIFKEGLSFLLNRKIQVLKVINIKEIKRVTELTKENVIKKAQATLIKLLIIKTGGLWRKKLLFLIYLSLFHK